MLINIKIIYLDLFYKKYANFTNKNIKILKIFIYYSDSIKLNHYIYLNS